MRLNHDLHPLLCVSRLESKHLTFLFDLCRRSAQGHLTARTIHSSVEKLITVLSAVAILKYVLTSSGA